MSDENNSKPKGYSTAVLSKALEMACKIGFSDDCPKNNLDSEPWPEGCDEVCIIPQEHWKCWKQHFINQVS